jgi:DNA-binding response OmpR family regulator
MSESSHNGRPVLIVEDDVDIRECLGELLEDRGYKVLLAGTGAEALDELSRADALPAIILLDLMMPVMDGWQFRAEQRKREAWDSIPVVIISAHDHARANTDSIGAFAYLRKPLNLNQLLAVVETAYASRPRPV